MSPAQLACCFPRNRQIISDDSIFYEGNLSFSPSDDSKRKDQWWVLNGLKGMMSNYKTKAKQRSKGYHLNITNAEVKRLDSDYEFTVHVKTFANQMANIYKFHASSEKDRVDWMEALETCSNGYASGISKRMANNRGLLNGKYVYVKELGRGSSGIVHLYTHHGKPYAIKKIRNVSEKMKLVSPKLQKSDVKEDADIQSSILSASTRREIAILKKISSIKYIVTLHEVICDPETGFIYLVMEYLEGGLPVMWNNDAKKYTVPGKDSTLDDYSAKKIMRCLVLGLKGLHSNNMCHRDIKPENILISSDRSTAKFIDFGLAHIFPPEMESLENAIGIENRIGSFKPNRQCEDGESNSATIKSPPQLQNQFEKKVFPQKRISGMLNKTEGTYQFFAPEMLSAQEYCGYCSDIWALGVTLYVFIYGNLPFYSPNTIELFDKIQNDGVVYPDVVGNELLRDLLNQILEKDPLKRITLHELINHEWLCSGVGSVSFLKEVKAGGKLFSVSDHDIDCAVTSLEEKFRLVKQSTAEEMESVMKKLYNSGSCDKISVDNINPEFEQYSPLPINTALIKISSSLSHIVELIAEQSHFIWCHRKILNNWKYGEFRNAEQKIHPALLPYKKLSESVKYTNVVAVQKTIKTVLSLGYKIIPKNPNLFRKKPIFPFVLENVCLPAHLVILSDLLAENSHEQWALDLINKGWKFGKDWDSDKKTHPSLIPYSYIPQDEKDGEKDLAITTLKTLLHCGYSICHEHEKYDEERHAIATNNS